MRALVLLVCSIAAGGAMSAAAQSRADYSPSPGSGIVRCESSDGRTRECPADTSRGMRMVRQISRASCIEGQSWGQGPGGIWVSQGCRADFAGGYGSSSSGGGYGAQVLRCESNDGRRKLCPVDARSGVELVRQLSRSPCLRNQSWGASQHGVWVSQGCRAEFRIGGGYGRDDDDDERAQVVRCESPRGASNQCRVDVRGGVRMLRQLSSSPCVEGRTWGQDRGGIWVSRGCRADFEIGRPGNDGDNGDRRPGGMAQVMKCESTEGGQQRCDVYIARGAQMIRQLSRSACIEGQSWGWDRNGVWVSGGCRAEFSIW
ncbi:MAG: DUF3011 domain-containing protein [Pseudomonadota bacterium]|nr:DUF3011 domain-containing protein [Pseudomonadota bacterium]